MSNKLTFKIDKAFESFIEACRLNHLPKNSVQIMEMKRSFYAGCHFTFQELCYNIPEQFNDDEEKVHEAYEEYSKELDNFIAGVEVGEL